MDGWQWTLHPHHVIKVWRLGRHELVAELPMTLVGTILAHYLAQAHLTAAVLTVQAPQRKALASAPARGRLLAVGVPLRPVQEARRAARATRSKRTRGAA